MTPATETLEKAGVNFSLLNYDAGKENGDYGRNAAHALQLPPQQVLKTLIVESDTGKLLVALVPVDRQLNMKKLARTAALKKVALAAAPRVSSATGYVIGGVSPIGQKLRLDTFISDTVRHLDVCYVSAGRRGWELALSPSDLLTVTRGKWADLTT
ncbi:Cys-tRNA(Pro) deacylase [Alteromonas sp. ASW11-19]|uniref:Cys-tRNA(Pro)/Cys-tRNA(Cys) deacylase n=1 Tax=Alteromonas salexigens TaxID=2982530 RepID=A0ABT2VKS7_9ALTE|nr:Cys-tRNA(Pro) deacylase [Alteromonas salexigens]MCU7553893.1 Cys-tRNA(Pro) deacylase [Alteromonas salexigens]